MMYESKAGNRLALIILAVLAAEDGDHPPAEVDVLHVELSGLSDPQGAAVQQFEEAGVPQVVDAAAWQRLEERADLGLRQRRVEQVGLAGLGHRRPNELSGGQQQRVAIARALVKKPVLVIADEPTANLDSENGEAVLQTMQALNQSLGTTFIFSSHDPMVVAHARRVVTLRDGRVVGDERKEATGGGR